MEWAQLKETGFSFVLLFIYNYMYVRIKWRLQSLSLHMHQRPCHLVQPISMVYISMIHIVLSATYLAARWDSSFCSKLLEQTVNILLK